MALEKIANIPLDQILPKNQDGHLTPTNRELKKCEICDDYQEFLREAIKLKGQIVVPEKIMEKRCYCQEQALIKKEQEEKRQKENALLMEKFKSAEIPPRFLNWDFKTINESENKTACQQYIDCFDINLLAGNGLLLIGNKGNGKTTLAIAMLKELIKAGYSAVFISFGEVLNRILATYSPSSLKDQRQILNDLLKFDFIIFDDFGREAYTEKQIQLAFWIIDELNKNMKCVCLTSNPEMIEKLKDPKRFRYSEEFKAILDRLNEMCKTNLIFEGRSFRSGEE